MQVVKMKRFMIVLKSQHRNSSSLVPKNEENGSHYTEQHYSLQLALFIRNRPFNPFLVNY